MVEQPRMLLLAKNFGVRGRFWVRARHQPEASTRTSIFAKGVTDFFRLQQGELVITSGLFNGLVAQW